MDRRKVIVTGGTGFIGTPVVDALIAKGHEVHVPSSRPETAGGTAGRWHHVDLLNQEKSRRFFEDVEGTDLIHLAWFVKPGQVWSSLENLRWVGASLDLLSSFAAAGGRRAVIAGSSSEYGPEGRFCSETRTSIAPSNLYGVSKAALGSIVSAAAPWLAIEICWARIFSAFGPREHPARLVGSVTRNLLLGEVAPCSEGHQKRDYLSTQDLAHALIALLESDVTGPVNVGSGDPVELRELVSRLATMIGRPDLVSFGAVTPPADDPPFLVADVSRLREEVGWRPGLSLDQGLAMTVEWWRSELTGQL